jgi:hypothetical protein
MLDMRSVDVVDKGYEIVVGHAIPRRKKVKVDELRRRPQQPFSYIKFTA